MKLANLRSFERAATDQRLRGMGTTMVGLSFPRGGEDVVRGQSSQLHVWNHKAG